MRILVDTNVLARLAQVNNPQHSIARDALRRLRDADHELRTVPQVLYDYWAVATRPAAQNGLGFSVEDTHAQLQQWQELFPTLRDDRGILGPWQQLVLDQRVLGRQSHDARIAAAITRHGLTHLLIFNAVDFRRYPGYRLLGLKQLQRAPSSDRFAIDYAKSRSSNMISAASTAIVL